MCYAKYHDVYIFLQLQKKLRTINNALNLDQDEAFLPPPPK
jgi:hypothetical protein